jgi:hypothetical protein
VWQRGQVLALAEIIAPHDRHDVILLAMTLLRQPLARRKHRTAFASTLSGLAIHCNWSVAGRPI